jgi:tetratricopeptide (TPR) repeat protein
MAKKLNRNLIGGLTAFGMIIVAAAGFVLLANLPGHDPKLYETQAKDLEAKGEFNRAGQTFMRAYNRDPQKNPQYLIDAAKCALEEGSIRDVRELISMARVKDPMLRSAADMSLGMELELAKLFGGSTQWNRVLTESQKLLKIEDQSVVGRVALALAYFNLEEQDSSFVDKSKPALIDANKLQPGNSDIIEALTRKQIAGVMEKASSGARDEAKKQGAETIDMITESLSRVTDKSSKQYSDLDRTRSLCRILLGSIRSILDQALVKQGLEELETLVAQDKSGPDTAILLAMTKAGQVPSEVKVDLPAAEAVLQKAIESWPDEGRLYSSLAQVIQLQRIMEADEATRIKLLDKEAALYRTALERVPRSKHFKKYRNNDLRNMFFRELFLQDINKVRTPDTSEDKKKEALASAQEWLNKIKQEEDPEFMVVRFMTATLEHSRGEIIAAIKDAEAADRQMGASQDILLQILLAELYMQQKQWGSAKKALDKAIRLRRDSGVLYLSLARVHLSMNQPALALTVLKTTAPDSVRKYLESNQDAIKARVEAYRQMNQFQLATDESKKLKDQGPDAIIREAQLLVLAEHYGEAESQLKALIEKDNNQENAVRILVQMYIDTHRETDARKMLESLSTAQPKNRLYRGLQLNLLEGDAATKDKKMLEFLKEEPDTLTRELSVADFYASREKYTDAMTHLDLAEQKAPKDAGVIDRQLRVAMAAKDWDRSNKYVLRDAELNLDGTEGKIAQGRLALAKKELDKAIELMRAGLTIYPSFSMGWTYLAEAYLVKGNRVDAKSALLKALEIDPTNAFANRGMADISMREGDNAGSRKYLDAASKLLKNEPWVKRTQEILKEKENPQEGISVRENQRKENPKDLENLVLLSRLYGDPKIKQFDKATETYREALKVSNNDLVLARELAMFLGREDVNRPSEGEALLAELLRNEQKNPQRALISVALGQFCESQKQLATADRHFRFAVEIDPSKEILDAVAQFSARTNRYKEAVEYYNRLLQVAKDDPKTVQTTKSRICALLLAMGDLEEAKKHVDEYVRLYPDDSEGIIYEGAYHRIGGDIQKAKQAFDRQLQRQPDNAIALWQRGQLSMLQGRWQSAVDDLQKAKAYDPDGFLYQHRIALANALIETDQAGQAIAELKSILEIKPEEDSVAEALIDAYCRVSPPRYQEAENLLIIQARRRPKEYKWYMLQGQVAEKRPDNYAKAAEAYEKAADIGRYKPEIIRALFRAYKKADMAGAIITYADTKLSTRMLTSMPLELSALAWAYWRQGQPDQALEKFDQAMFAAGQDFITYSRVINDMIACLGRDKTLQRVMDQAQKDPENVEKQKALVHMLHSDRKLDEAIEVCNKVIKLAVRNEDKVFALVGQGMILEQQKKFDEARLKYEAALKINQEEPTALNNLAYLLVDRMKKPREALPYAEQANRLRKRMDANVLDTLGWVQAENSLLRDAAGTLLRAMEMDHDNVAVQYHLGIVHRRLGELDEARARLKSAQKLAKSEEDKEFLPKITQELTDLDSHGK